MSLRSCARKQGIFMSVKFKKLVEAYQGGLTRSEFHVLHYLGGWAKDDGNAAISVNRIAKDTHYCVRTIKYRLRSLEQKGVIRTTGKAGGRGHFNCYSMYTEPLCGPFPTPSPHEEEHEIPPNIPQENDLPGWAQPTIEEQLQKRYEIRTFRLNALREAEEKRSPMAGHWRERLKKIDAEIAELEGALHHA